MAITVTPEAYSGPRDSLDGKGWELFGEFSLENPRLLVPDIYAQVIDLWFYSRSEGGRGWLPDAGGVNDQSSWLMSAFQHLNVVFAKLKGN